MAKGAQYLLYSKSYIQRSIQSHRPAHNVLTACWTFCKDDSDTSPLNNIRTYISASCLAPHMRTWGQATCLQVTSLSGNMFAMLTAQLHMHIATLALEALCACTLACSGEVNYAQRSTSSHVAGLALQALNALRYCLPIYTENRFPIQSLTLNTLGNMASEFSAIDGFHSIFPLGNWRALHHHAAC